MARCCKLPLLAVLHQPVECRPSPLGRGLGALRRYMVTLVTGFNMLTFLHDLLDLIRRNLSFHARAHLGVVLGAAIGSAALDRRVGGG